MFSFVLEHNEISWCSRSKTLNAPHLVLFSRQAARHAAFSLLPFPSSQQCMTFLWSQDPDRCLCVEQDSTNEEEHSHTHKLIYFRQWWGGVAVWPLHRAALSLPQVRTWPATQVQVFMGLGGCILFGKSSWRGLYKMFRSNLPAMKSHPCLGVITGLDEVCQEDLHAARLLNGCISRETALIYSLVSVAHCSPTAWTGRGMDKMTWYWYVLHVRSSSQQQSILMICPLINLRCEKLWLSGHQVTPL